MLTRPFPKPNVNTLHLLAIYFPDVQIFESSEFEKNIFRKINGIGFDFEQNICLKSKAKYEPTYINCSLFSPFSLSIHSTMTKLFRILVIFTFLRFNLSAGGPWQVLDIMLRR